MSRFVVIDRCPVPSELAELVTLLKHDRPHAQLQSCYRGEDAKTLLHANGKHTQAEVFQLHAQGVPGFGPANPPDRGSHLLLGDGAFGRLHEKLDPRQCGMDWNDAEIARLIDAAKARGWALVRPYSSQSEYHHLCAKDWPALGVVLGMKRGSHRQSVGDLTRRLHYLDLLDGRYVHTVFDDHVEAAVKDYQGRKHIRPDGVVGVKTWEALDRSVRARKRNR